jgi:hypothetical protein
MTQFPNRKLLCVIKIVDEKTTPSEFICRSSGAQHEAAARRGQNTLTQRRIDGQNDDYLVTVP